jgi:hypothetical protein
MWVDCHERAVGVVANCFTNAVLKCWDWNTHVEGDIGGPFCWCEWDVRMRKGAEELVGEWVGAICEECHASRVVDGKFERPCRERLKLQLLSLHREDAFGSNRVQFRGVGLEDVIPPSLGAD